MYIEELLRVFDAAAAGFPVLQTERAREELRRAIEGKKYDLQDQALIEAIIRQDSRDLVESFAEAYGPLSGGLEDGDEDVKEAIRIYIASLEHLINYYHTSLIGKHFSST
jgi:hypothetical protein